MTRTQQSTQRVIIYKRLSDDRSGAGANVATQERLCRVVAADEGMTVVDVLTDNDKTAYGRNGRRAVRPAYDKLTAMLTAGKADAVLVWNIDRLYRESRDLEPLIDLARTTRTVIYSATSGKVDLNTADGKMVARIKAVVSTAEIERGIERMHAKKDANRLAGVNPGGPRPYGFRKVKPHAKGQPAQVPQVDKVEAEFIRRAARGVLAGDSLRAVCADLNAAGARTARGLPWAGTSLSKMLQSARLVAKIEHQGEIIGDAKWDPILDMDVWLAVRGVLRDPSRKSNAASDNKVKWLGSGIYRCHCGNPMRAGGTRAKLGKTMYRCDLPGGGHATRAAVDVDGFVESVLVARLARADLAVLTEPQRGDTPAAVDLAARATALRAKLAGYVDDYDADLITRAQMIDGTAKTRARLTETETAMAEAARAAAPPAVATVDLPELTRMYYGDPAAVPDGDPVAAQAARAAAALEWFRDTYSTERRRLILAELMTVTVLPAKRGRPQGYTPGSGTYFDPKFIRIDWVPTPSR